MVVMNRAGNGLDHGAVEWTVLNTARAPRLKRTRGPSSPLMGSVLPTLGLKLTFLTLFYFAHRKIIKPVTSSDCIVSIPNWTILT